MSIWKKFLGSYGKDVKNAAKMTAASLDPDRWSTAVIAEKQQKLKDFAQKQIAAEDKVASEKNDVVNILALRDSHITNVKTMQKELETCTDTERIQLLNNLIDSELTLLENMKVDIEREKREVVEAEADLTSIREAVSMLKQQVDMMEEGLNKVRSNIERAEQEAERLKLKEELKQQKEGALAVDDTFDMILKNAQARVDEINQSNRANVLIESMDKKNTTTSVEAVVAEINKKNAPVKSVADRLAAIEAN